MRTSTSDAAALAYGLDKKKDETIARLTDSGAPSILDSRKSGEGWSR